MPLNLILGCKYVVQAWSDPKTDLGRLEDGGRQAERGAAEKLEPCGFEGRISQPSGGVGASGRGQRPMDILAKNTKPSVMLQLDVGTCLEARCTIPVAWIRANPGRIRSIHCKEWSPDPDKSATRLLFGRGRGRLEGNFPGGRERVGGVGYYLIEQEGSRFSEFETARKCLQAFRATHA